MCRSKIFFGLAFPFPEISFSSLDKELFAAYAFYAGIVTLKMLIMSPLTARQRFKTNTFISSEDAVRPGTKVNPFVNWTANKIFAATLDNFYFILNLRHLISNMN